MADVFLSFSRGETDVAVKLATELRAAGLSVLFEPSAGEPMSHRAENIQKSRAFVFLVPDKIEGSWQQFEFKLAMRRSMTGDLLIFPVQILGRNAAADDIQRFPHIHVQSERDLSPVVEVVSKALRSAGPSGPSLATLRISFLTSLLRTDLDHAPLAASLVLDEISQSVDTEIVDVMQQIDLLRDATAWGRAHLSAGHPSVTLLMYRFSEALFSLGYYEESALLSREILATTSNPKDQQRASVNLGRVLLRTGKTSEAETYYQRALSVAGYTADPAAGISLVALGTIYQQRDDQDQALKFFQQAVDRSTALTSPTIRVQALLGLSETLHALGDLDKGRRYAKEALQIIKTELNGDRALELRAFAAAGDEQ